MASDLDEWPLLKIDSSNYANRSFGSVMPILARYSLIQMLHIFKLGGKRREKRSNPLHFSFIVQMYLRRMIVFWGD